MYKAGLIDALSKLLEDIDVKAEAAWTIRNVVIAEERRAWQEMLHYKIFTLQSILDYLNISILSCFFPFEIN